jgi:DHA1 family multidrug resistance protein-like MFS transporter
MTGALICGAALGLTSGIYDICWTLLLLARGASGLAIGISWTLFAVPFVLAAKPSGWLADHMDRRVLVLVGIGTSTVLCATYPFIHSVTALVLLGAAEALGFAAAMPAVQSLLSQGSAPSEVGRIQGLFATSQTACTAVSAAAAGAAFALASWLPFVAAAALCSIGLVVATAVWWKVPGRVDRTVPSDGSGGFPDDSAIEVPAVRVPQLAVPEAVGVSVDVQ